MKATPYILAAACGVGAYIITRLVVSGSLATSVPPVNAPAATSAAASGSAGDTNPAPSSPDSQPPLPPGYPSASESAPSTSSPIVPDAQNLPQLPPGIAGPVIPPGGPIVAGTNPPAPGTSPALKRAAPKHAKPAVRTTFYNSNPIVMPPAGEGNRVASADTGSSMGATSETPSSTTGDTEGGPHIDIAASLMLGLMDKRYHAINSFAATMDCRDSSDPYTSKMHAQIAFRRHPERAVALVSAPSAQTVLYDGSNVVVYPAPDASHYTRTVNYFKNLAGSGITAVLGHLVDDPSRDILSRLIAADYNSQRALEPFQSLSLAGQIEVDNALCDRVVAVRDSDTVTLLIGHADHLLRRITWSSNSTTANIHDGVAEPVLDVPQQWYFEEFDNVRTTTGIAPRLFVFKPPAGVTQFSTP